MQYMNSEELIQFLKTHLKESLLSSYVVNKKEGTSGEEYQTIWLEIVQQDFKEAVKLLASIHYPHISIIAGNDTGESVELIYLFTIYYAERFKEISIHMRVKLDKNNPRTETITDIIPGAQTTERETKEMFGVEFDGLPDMHNIFLPEDFPKDVFPFRKNQKGLDELVQKES